MPPKKKAPEPSKKTEMKKKEKVIEDKTFGLKNKKGAKTQKFIQQVEKQVKFGNQPAKKVEAVPVKKKGEAEDLNSLFRPVQKVEKGADPKSVLCAFFKQGTCGKGDKCKFSHDITIERKAEKRDITPMFVIRIQWRTGTRLSWLKWWNRSTERLRGACPRLILFASTSWMPSSRTSMAGSGSAPAEGRSATTAMRFPVRLGLRPNERKRKTKK
uniref:Putative translation machinery-associated protein n=1 Tax=Ixodes ricinus TaxID=34613 RepID=A0A0K8RGD0_IXORI